MADGPTTGPDRLASTRAHLDDLLEKHPEMLPYTRPASAGDIADLGKKLDEIAGLLRSALSPAEAAALKSLLDRFVAKKRAEPSHKGGVDPDHVPTAAELGAAIEMALRPTSTSQSRPASAREAVARLLARLWGMTRRCLP